MVLTAASLCPLLFRPQVGTPELRRSDVLRVSDSGRVSTRRQRLSIRVRYWLRVHRMQVRRQQANWFTTRPCWISPVTLLCGCSLVADDEQAPHVRSMDSVHFFTFAFHSLPVPAQPPYAAACASLATLSSSGSVWSARAREARRSRLCWAYWPCSLSRVSWCFAIGRCSQWTY